LRCKSGAFPSQFDTILFQAANRPFFRLAELHKRLFYLETNFYMAEMKPLLKLSRCTTRKELRQKQEHLSFSGQSITWKKWLNAAWKRIVSRPPHLTLYAVGAFKLANVECPNWLRMLQILATL
jgi:hypothetical protein